ncbi:MAG: S-formylglutathione hydrolase [Gammaproteobacteria bacterium]|nr:S-formylglutathione hydrolase [Gammaproteobacteria bacterium]
MKVLAEHRVFDGSLSFCAHDSSRTGTEMRYSIFLPAAAGDKLPLLWWLSGLTCTEENFTIKAGAYRAAAQYGLAIIAPDTSPRGDAVPDVDAYDLGQGAGFYVDATEPPWDNHFRMYSYITDELQSLVIKEYPVDSLAQGIAGHSMGGHGALTIGLRHPDRYRSLSAFAPIVAPCQVPWGQQAFTAYLGDDSAKWQEHDATSLMAAAGDRSTASPILVDQGLADVFLEEQLRPELFAAACESVGQALELRCHENYDHSYFFVSSFIDDHIAHHTAILRN